MESEDKAVIRFRKWFKRFINKVLVSLVLLILCLIICKTNVKAKKIIKKYVLSTSFNFVKFEKIYTKYLGSLKKDSKDISVSKTVNNYNFVNYLDGQKSLVEDDNIYSFHGGIVIYKGMKEGYNNVVIIQGSDGYDIWYGNLNNINVNMYDYIESDTLIGNVNGELYLLITKDGKNYTYDEYIKEN